MLEGSERAGMSMPVPAAGLVGRADRRGRPGPGRGRCPAPDAPRRGGRPRRHRHPLSAARAAGQGRDRGDRRPHDRRGLLSSRSPATFATSRATAGAFGSLEMSQGFALGAGGDATASAGRWTGGRPRADPGGARTDAGRGARPRARAPGRRSRPARSTRRSRRRTGWRGGRLSRSPPPSTPCMTVVAGRWTRRWRWSGAGSWLRSRARRRGARCSDTSTTSAATAVARGRTSGRSPPGATAPPSTFSPSGVLTLEIVSSRRTRPRPAAGAGGVILAPAGETANQEPPKALIPSPLVSPGFLSFTNVYSGCPL